jgi:hypothetical protein
MFKCPDCLYLTDRRHNLNRHIKTKHHTCQKQSDSTYEKNVNKNDENVHSEKYICKSCKKEYKTKQFYNKHITNCNLEDKNQCPYCRKHFSSRKTKSRHLKTCQIKKNQINDQQEKMPTFYGYYIDGFHDNERNFFGNIINNHTTPEDMIEMMTMGIDVRKLIEFKDLNPDHVDRQSNDNIRENDNFNPFKFLTKNELKLLSEEQIFEHIFDKCRDKWFMIFLKQCIAKRYQLTEQETEELIQRWKKYEIKQCKTLINFINIHSEEITKQREKK